MLIEKIRRFPPKGLRPGGSGTEGQRHALRDVEGIWMLQIVPIPKPQERARLVLVVEDEVLIRMMIADELRRAGLEVVEASNADEALQYLASGHSVDLVFTDVQMPGRIDGIALARRVAHDYPGIKVLMTSAHGRPPEPSFDASFVAKPYAEDEVVRRIADALATC
jgi:CheY-like chemotaxis protein